MVDKVKVYISELNNVDLVYKREYLLKAENVPYEDSPSSVTLKEKIDSLEIGGVIRRLTNDLQIQIEETIMFRNPVLEANVVLTIAQTGEMHCL